MIQRLNTPFFIIGTGRCGTKMLRNMLIKNKNIKILPETHFIPTLYDKYKMGEISYNQFYDVIDNIYASGGYKWIDVILNDAKKDYKKFYQDFKLFTNKHIKNKNIKGYIECLFEYLYGPDKIYGDKTPHYGTVLNIIKKIWPDAKIIHLIRDGIYTARSMRKHIGFVKHINGKIQPRQLDRIMYKGKNVELSDKAVSMKQALQFWEEVILSIFNEVENIEKKYVITVRYEDLLFYPENEIKKITRFLGLDFNDKWIKKAIEVPRPFPDRKKSYRLSKEEYYRYYKLVKKGMDKSKYPYDIKIKRNFFEIMKEIYRGRRYYLRKIDFTKYLKKMRRVLIRKKQTVRK